MRYYEPLDTDANEGVFCPVCHKSIETPSAYGGCACYEELVTDVKECPECGHLGREKYRMDTWECSTCGAKEVDLDHITWKKTEYNGKTLSHYAYLGHFQLSVSEVELDTGFKWRIFTKKKTWKSGIENTVETAKGKAILAVEEIIGKLS